MLPNIALQFVFFFFFYYNYSLLFLQRPASLVACWHWVVHMPSTAMGKDTWRRGKRLLIPAMSPTGALVGIVDSLWLATVYLLCVCVCVCACLASKLGAEAFEFEGNDPVTRTNERMYLLRPETVESFFVMWRLTHNQMYRDWGWEVVQVRGGGGERMG